MLAFLFDGTFEGLLCCVFDAYTTKRFPALLLAHGEITPLTVTATHTVKTNRDNADRVFTGVVRRLSREGKNTLLLAYLSELPGIATLLFRYIRKVLDAPASKEGDFTDSDMLTVDQIARKVFAEHHLLLGFARFQKTAQGIYFAALRPKYNVLSLMLPHFMDRFAGHQWILYDGPRGFGFFHDAGDIKDITLDCPLAKDGALPEELLAEDEKTFQEMWNKYFAATAIRERSNPKLQARCMPRRYWPYMNETRGAARNEKTGQSLRPGVSDRSEN